MKVGKHHAMLDELIDEIRKDMHKMLDNAYKCGGLPEYFKDENSYILPKAIITIWGRKEHYIPFDKTTKNDVANLEHFI